MSRSNRARELAPIGPGFRRLCTNRRQYARDDQSRSTEKIAERWNWANSAGQSKAIHHRALLNGCTKRNIRTAHRFDERHRRLKQKTRMCSRIALSHHSPVPLASDGQAAHGVTALCAAALLLVYMLARKFRWQNLHADEA